MGDSVVTAAGGVHGFPAALTSFIGRAGPLREVAALLERHRLVTVTGPGGAGKTRLADQVARRAAGRFADGAWLVELAPVQDPAQVAAAVAAALGVGQLLDRLDDRFELLTEDPGPRQPEVAPGLGALSSRERELVTLVAQGATDAQIAGRLYISVRTVRSHLDRIRDKTGCRRRADLTRLALAAGLI